MNDDQSVHLAIATAVARALGSKATPVRYATGSVPVFAVDDFALKLFPPSEASYLANESAVLRAIDGHLPLPTPRILATGRCDGWYYLAMSRLDGRPLDEVWGTIPSDDRVRLMVTLGEGIAALHAIPHEGLAGVSADWDGFVVRWCEDVRTRQSKKGLAAPWLDQVAPFLTRHLHDDGRRALLHTEIMRQHVLAAPGADGWRITGLVDYEPSMVGAPEYELSSVGVFTSCAEPGLFGAYLEGYGAKWDASLPNRVMAQAILHRYSNLRWYLERLGDFGTTDLEALAAAWFRP